MPTPFLLYSKSYMRSQPDEFEAVVNAFGADNVSDLITDVPAGSVVVPRYRAIPFGEETERDISALGSKLVNTYRQHRNIADMFTWVHLLEGMTPPVYDVDDMPYLPEGEYFVKGETNSKKNSWFTSSYAPDKKTLPYIVSNLQSDHYVGSQRIAIRPFQRYRQLGNSVDNRPIFHERRVFVLDGQVLSQGFYWSSHVGEYGDTVDIVPGAFEFTVAGAISRVGHLARLIVIDFAEYEDGTWGVVELNDGSMSGLSENDPYTLWKNFVDIVSKR